MHIFFLKYINHPHPARLHGGVAMVSFLIILIQFIAKLYGICLMRTLLSSEFMSFFQLRTPKMLP